MKNTQNNDIEDLQGEIWVEVLGYDSKYFVSNKARVKSFKFHKPALLSQQTSSNGYIRVELWKNGQRTNCAISRLVAQAFVPNDDPINKTTVDHIDGDKTNNLPENLQWLSLRDNIRAYYNK